MYIIDDDYSGRSWNNSTRLIKRYTNAIGSSVNLTASDI